MWNHGGAMNGCCYDEQFNDDIEEQVKKACETAKEKDGGVLFVTEGVIGVTGEFAPIDKIVALKEKYDFLLIVEDAHGFGTVGPNRIGVADHFGVQTYTILYARMNVVTIHDSIIFAA